MKVKRARKAGQVTVELAQQDARLLEKGLKSAAASTSPFKLRKILVPVDFSEFSSKALDYALAFAQQFDARILLLHVVEPAIYPENYMVVPKSFDDLNENLINAAKERLARITLERIGRRANADSEVRLGRPFFEIVDAAKSLGVDLIIIGTHGYTGLKHVLLGSTAERVVRHAPCPVLTVRVPEREFVERA
jgi:nucleotide-binding universal stress UspA family protein